MFYRGLKQFFCKKNSLLRKFSHSFTLFSSEKKEYKYKKFLFHCDSKNSFLQTVFFFFFEFYTVLIFLCSIFATKRFALTSFLLLYVKKWQKKIVLRNKIVNTKMFIWQSTFKIFYYESIISKRNLMKSFLSVIVRNFLAASCSVQ